MIKHIVGFFISICVVVTSMLNVFAMQDDIIKLSLSQERVKQGENIELTVSAESGEQCRGIQFILTYDIGKLTAVGTERGPLAQDAIAVSVDDKKPGKITVVLAFEQAYSLNGDAVKLKFKVKDKTGLGSTKISVKNVELADADNNMVSAGDVDAIFEIYSDEVIDNIFPTINPTPAPKPGGTNAPATEVTSLPAASTPSNKASSGGRGSSSAPVAAAAAVPEDKTNSDSDPTAVRKNLTAAEKGCGFNDITGHWAAEDIVYLYNKGIINGLSEEEFAPEKSVTRAEFIKMISMIAEFAPAHENPFSDVNLSDWYYEPILKGYSSGIINGYGKIFAPNRDITREEMAVIADRCMEYMGIYSESDKMESKLFSDSASLSEWSVSSVIKMANAGVINGINGAFVPGANTTRAQAAVVIKRIYMRSI